MSDKISLCLLHLKASPFAYYKDLNELADLVSKSKRQINNFIGAIIDSLEVCLPKQRLLVSMYQRYQNLNNGIQNTFQDDFTCASIAFEDCIIQYLDKIINVVLYQYGKEELAQCRIIATDFSIILLDYPSTQQIAINYLGQRLADKDNKVQQNLQKDIIEAESHYPALIQLLLTKLSIQDINLLHNNLIILNKIYNKNQQLKRQSFLNADVINSGFILIKSILDSKDQDKLNQNILKQLIQLLNKLFGFEVDFSKIQGLEQQINYLIEVNKKLPLATQMSVYQLLVNLINSLHINQTTLNKQTLDSIIKSITTGFYNLLLNKDMIYVNRKNHFNIFIKIIEKLHQTVTQGLNSNIQFNKAVFKRTIQQLLMSANPEALQNFLQVEFDQVALQNQQKQLEFAFNEYNYMKSNSQESVDYEAMLLQVHYNPSVQKYANNYLKIKPNEYYPERQVKASLDPKSVYPVEQPYGIECVMDCIQGYDNYIINKQNPGKIDQKLNQYSLDIVRKLFQNNKENKKQQNEIDNNNLINEEVYEDEDGIFVAKNEYDKQQQNPLFSAMNQNVN